MVHERTTGSVAAAWARSASRASENIKEAGILTVFPNTRCIGLNPKRSMNLFLAETVSAMQRDNSSLVVAVCWITLFNFSLKTPPARSDHGSVNWLPPQRDFAGTTLKAPSLTLLLMLAPSSSGEWISKLSTFSWNRGVSDRGRARS